MRLGEVCHLITSIVGAADQNMLWSKRKAINALFPHAVHLARGGQQGMIDSCVTGTSTSGEFMWHCVGPYIATLFDKPTPPSLNSMATLASPRVPWHDKLHDEKVVARWATAASSVPYTEEVGQAVVDTFLQIAFIDFLRPQIPTNMWAWLERRPPLPLRCSGRSIGTRGSVLHRVRALGNMEILKSYFLSSGQSGIRLTTSSETSLG